MFNLARNSVTNGATLCICQMAIFRVSRNATTQLSCTVVDEVVAPGLRGFLAMKISPGGILGARTASLRHGYAIDHQSELILVPNASAEKRTSEQPTGKRTSVTPRDKRIVADTSGADAAKSAMTIPPKTDPR